MWEVYGIMFFVLLGIVALWVKGIDYMKEKYPNYEGEDFFNEEDKDEIL